MDIRKAAIAPTILAVSLLVAIRVGAADPTPAASGSPAAADAKTITTASGLKYVDITVGTGRTPKTGETVAVKYAVLANGKRIEGTAPSIPFVFKLGQGQALKALDEGVSTMKVGGHRQLLVPPELGYGTEGVSGRVPPNAVLEFDVELLEIR